jgi:hypothetical protein
MFGRVSKKKVSGRTNPRPKIGDGFFPERAKKELNFETALNEEKCYSYKRVNFFPLAAEYFGQSRRIIAERVGNTVLEESQDGNFQIMINQLTQPMPAILHSLPF